MDKFGIYAKAANFNGKILFLMQIFRSASGGPPTGALPLDSNGGLPSPRLLCMSGNLMSDTWQPYPLCFGHAVFGV